MVIAQVILEAVRSLIGTQVRVMVLGGRVLEGRLEREEYFLVLRNPMSVHTDDPESPLAVVKMLPRDIIEIEPA